MISFLSLMLLLAIDVGVIITVFKERTDFGSVYKWKMFIYWESLHTINTNIISTLASGTSIKTVTIVRYYKYISFELSEH